MSQERDSKNATDPGAMKFLQYSADQFRAQVTAMTRGDGGFRAHFDQDPIWLDALIAYVVPAADTVMYCAVVDEAQTALCLLPMWRKNSQPSPTRTLEALANFYTTHAALLLRPHADIRACITAVISGIAAQQPRWDVVDINPLAAKSDEYTQLLQGFKACNFWVKPYFRFANWYLEVAGRCFDDYWANVPTSLRNTLERKKRKLTREVGYRLHIFDNEQDLTAALTAYEQVYAASWKDNESHPEFIRELLQNVARAGWLRLGVLYIQDVPAAAQIWFVKDNVASIFKLAYDARFEKYSAGSILTAHLMRHVIDADKVTVVDFLSGDDDYKKDWMSHRSECLGLRAYNLRTPRGVLLAAREIAAAMFKRLRSKTSGQ